MSRVPLGPLGDLVLLVFLDPRENPGHLALKADVENQD